MALVKTLVKSDNSPVRAAAAKKLAHDPDPATAKALVSATQDKNWVVRMAALEAIAHCSPELIAGQASHRSHFRSIHSRPQLAATLDYFVAACVAAFGRTEISTLEGKRFER